MWSPERKVVAITCGAEGCWYLDDAAPFSPQHQPAFRVTVVDTTGCGDVFHGAYAAALVREMPRRRANSLRLGGRGAQSDQARRPIGHSHARRGRTISEGANRMNGGLVQDLEQALGEVPVLDIHTHLVGGQLAPAGCTTCCSITWSSAIFTRPAVPSGERLTQYPGWPSEEEAHRRIAEAVPFLSIFRTRAGFGACESFSKIFTAGASRSRPDNWRRAGRADPRAGRRPRLASRRSWIGSTSVARARKSPGAAGRG